MYRTIWSLIATGFGSGRAPYLPGTVGSLVGLTFWLAAHWLFAGGITLAASLAILATVGGLIATKHHLAAHPTSKDPQEVVIDEWAGLYITLLGVSAITPTQLALAFLLFRIFDMTKPGPIRKLEQLPGALGVMADDLAAGLCSLLTLHLIVIWIL